MFKFVDFTKSLFHFFEICAGSSITTESVDLTKLLSPNDLIRARNAGLSDQAIVKALSLGWSVEKMIEFISIPDPNYINGISEFLVRLVTDN